MTRVLFGATCCSTIACLTILNFVGADLQDFMNLQHRRSHLPETKFGYGEYSDYPEAEEREHAREDLAVWDHNPSQNIKSSRLSQIVTEEPIDVSDALDPNIVWDKDWIPDLNIGQLSAVDVDPQGNVAIFSRRERVWGLGTFDNNNKFDRCSGPIKSPTILLFDKHGKKILEWGKNMFYLPHGLTIDHEGNYWITDVALHQVFKFDAKDIEKNWQKFKEAENERDLPSIDSSNERSQFNKSIIKPSMILGEPFQPGDDNQRFCKPTAVAVSKNGDFFVSDGYCNSRIIKYNKNGEKILQWGRPWSGADTTNKLLPSYALFVPHALAIDEEQNLIYVADREDGRVVAYHSENGSYHREYKYPAVGTKIYSIAYALGKLYIINNPDVYTRKKFHVRGFVVDVKTGNIVSQFGPGRNDMLAPHDIAVTRNGAEIYVVEINANKIYRFTQVVGNGNSTSTEKIVTVVNSHHNAGLLTDDGISDLPTKGTGIAPLVLSVIVSAMILVGLCLVIAVLVARCQKRGCLLSVRRKSYWENDNRENFKLTSLLETRQGKNFKILEKRPNPKDFSKLSTEPETSEDDHIEDSLII